MDRLKKLLILNFALAVAYTLFSIPYAKGICILAFAINFLFTLVLGYMTIFKVIKEDDVDHIYFLYSLFYYQPCFFTVTYIMYRCEDDFLPFYSDLASTILWVLCAVISLILGNRYFNIKKIDRLYKIKPEWREVIEPNLPDKLEGSSRFVFGFIDLFNDIIQVFIALFIINIFVFQLYVIPSESMVPAFLIKDRVFVFKTFSGPRFPLSNVTLPDIQKYKRGDIVVVRNPHYGEDHSNEKSFTLNNFVSTMTLGIVQINKDDEGQTKADPLVKRLIGLPEDQLLMMDGTLYLKNKQTKEWVVYEQDNSWAAWNLNETNYNIQTKIKWIPLEQEDYNNFIELEEKRKSMDMSEAANTCFDLYEKFVQYVKGGYVDEALLDQFFTAEDMYEFNLFNNLSDETVKLLTEDGGRQWFYHFMNDWYQDLDLTIYNEDGNVEGDNLMGGNLYEDSRWRLNVMVKILFGRILVRNAELIKDGVMSADWSKDKERSSYYEQAQILSDYIVRMDLRNMPLLTLPQGEYFMMGDNRFNSLDMRHSYQEELKPLTGYDKYSASYYSNINVHTVKKDKILGKASILYWPLNRFRFL